MIEPEREVTPYVTKESPWNRCNPASADRRDGDAVFDRRPTVFRPGSVFLLIYNVTNAVKHVFGTVRELVDILQRGASAQNENGINV